MEIVGGFERLRHPPLFYHIELNILFLFLQLNKLTVHFCNNDMAMVLRSYVRL